MCNTNTIAQAMIAGHYNGDQAAYYEAIAVGEIHQCNGEWFVDGCELCEQIIYCNCENIISIPKKITETQRNVFAMWRLNTLMSLTGRSKTSFRSSFDGDYVEHPVQSVVDKLQDEVKSFEQRRFINTIKEELIASVMHPYHIQNQMNQFDDIEQFFTAMGC